jgi:uncharacterized protein YceK
MADARIGRRRLGAVLALVVTATLVVGCASVNRLREAQESFNQAATLENELRFDAALQEGSMQGQLTQNTTMRRIPCTST